MYLRTDYRSLRKAFVALIACVVLSVPASLQAQKIYFENHSLKTGLPQNTINDIAQDKQGYIWFATQIGAVRYDGYDYQVISTMDGLPDDFVNDILVTSDNSIYFATENGIGVLKNGGYSSIGEDEGLINRHVDGMLEDANGHIWAWSAYGISAITENGIYTYDGDSALFDDEVLKVFADSRGHVHVSTHSDKGVTIFSSPQSFEKDSMDQFIRDIIEPEPGVIWYGTQGDGIIEVRRGNMKKIGPEDGLTGSTVLSLHKDREGRIWIGTWEEGIFYYDDGKVKHLDTDFDNEILPMEIMLDRHDRLWIRGYDDGVWMIDEKYGRHYTAINNLIDNDVYCFMEDSFGSIWIGTHGGVSRLGRSVFEIYDAGSFKVPGEDEPVPYNKNVQAVHHDQTGRTWFSAGSSVHFIEKGQVNTLAEFESFEEEMQVLCFGESEDGRIFMGTDRTYLLVYNKGSLNRLELEASINDMLFMENGDLWFATDDGIRIWDQKSTRIVEGKRKLNLDTLSVEDGLPSHIINSLELCPEGVFCATGNGLSLFNVRGDHIRNIGDQQGLPERSCLDLAWDQQKGLWISTKSHGLARMDLASMEISTFGLAQGLLSNTTYFVSRSSTGAIWVGSNQGVSSIMPGENTIKNYSQPEGFTPLETNLRAVSMGEDGEMWIGSIEGLVHYDLRFDIPDQEPLLLHLLPPRVNGKELETLSAKQYHIHGEFPGTLSLPYNMNDLVFHFTGIHTLTPSRNNFRWMLEGFDEDWSLPGKAREASYPRLPKGQYTFRVEVGNPANLHGPVEKSFSFVIRAPFWEKSWFIIIDVLLGLLLIYGLVKWRERRLYLEKKKLEAKVLARTREIEDQKVQIEAQRDEIAIQNKEITDSILYAKRIQQAVLPGRITLSKHLPEHFIMFRPRDIVSGDFYWVERIKNKIIVVGADCTGHGVPGAFMSLLGLTFLNEIVNHEGIVEADQILNKLRDNIIKAMTHREDGKQQEHRDGMDLSLIVIDTADDSVDFAGAYNPLIIARRGNLLEHKGDKMPVGKHVVDGQMFTSNRIELEEGDMLYLFSDGFPDQFGGERGGKYKARPFRALLQRIAKKHTNEQQATLEEEFDKWKGNEPQVDDVLVMGIRYTK